MRKEIWVCLPVVCLFINLHAAFFCDRPSCFIAEPICPSCVDNETCIIVDTPGANTTTLKDAIEAANNSDATVNNPFVITFDVDDTISIDEELPLIKKPVCINGFVSNDDECARNITLEIEGDGTISNGLIFVPGARGSTIKGISIGNFTEINIGLNASSSLIAGNNVGIHADGFTPYNTKTAVGIKVGAGTQSTIGGCVCDAANIVSAVKIGIDVQTHEVTVIGNLIGTDSTGSAMIGNDDVGIRCIGNFNCIGIPAKKVCNVSSSSGRNVVAANGLGEESADQKAGIVVFGTNNAVTNCFVGTDITGSVLPVSGNLIGILVSGAHNIIAHSVIAGNQDDNIRFRDAHSSTLIGSLIGTDSRGRISYQTTTSIFLERSTHNTIVKNSIGSLGTSGITLFQSSNNIIRDNRIGNDTFRRSLGRRSIGILLCDAELEAGCPEGFTEIVPDIESDVSTMSLPESEINSVAARNESTAKRGGCRSNCLPCSETPCPEPSQAPDLIGPFSSAQNRIEGNRISSNTTAGIFLFSVQNNIIKGNWIGTDAEGNGGANGYGIIASNGVQNNLILRNTIQGNNFNGILIGPTQDAPSEVPFNDTMLNNTIFCNGESGIKLFGGGNRCLSAPNLTKATEADELLFVWVTGFFDDSCYTNATFLIQFFANSECRLGITEGQAFMASRVIETDENGFASFLFRLPLPSLAAEAISATVTRIDTETFGRRDTSEFSPSVVICS